jgi:hypothetical protein
MLVVGGPAESPQEGDSVRGSPCGEPARLRTGLQGSIPSDPGIRGPLHPPRHRSPPSPYRIGTPRSGASPEAAHRPSRCTASAGTEPWRPASLCPPFFLLRGTPGSAFLTGVGRPPPAATPPTLLRDTSHGWVFTAEGTARIGPFKVQALSRDIPGGCRYCGWRSVPRPQTARTNTLFYSGGTVIRTGG